MLIFKKGYINSIYLYVEECDYVFITMRKMTVQEGMANKVIKRFSKKGIVEEQEGFIDVTVMKKKIRRGKEEEVIIMTRWESEKYWKKWQTSDAHIAGHTAKRGQSKPDYLIKSESGRYKIEAVKEARA